MRTTAAISRRDRSRRKALCRVFSWRTDLAGPPAIGRGMRAARRALARHPPSGGRPASARQQAVPRPYRQIPPPAFRSLGPRARRTPTRGYAAATQSPRAGKRVLPTRHLARLGRRAGKPGRANHSLPHSLDDRARLLAAALPLSSGPPVPAWGYDSPASAGAAARLTSAMPEARRMAFSTSRQSAEFSLSACLAASRPCANRSSLYR
jgi:hypothetical protein